MVDWSNTFKNLLYYYSPTPTTSVVSRVVDYSKCDLHWPACELRAETDLHYIQHFCLCVQMSIESEMSHQRFRFLLQSGVWHLPFFYLLGSSVSLCSMRRHHKPHASCAAVSFPPEKASTSCRSCPPARLSSSPLPPTLSLASPSSPVPSSLSSSYSSSHFAHPWLSPLSLHSTPTRVTPALSRWRPCTTPIPRVPPAPVWPALTLSAAQRVPSSAPSSSFPPSPIPKTCPAYPRSRPFR